MAKQSFDIKASRKKTAPPASKAKTQKKQSHPRLATRAPKRKLRDRRREEFLRTVTLIVFGAAIVAGLLLYILWLPSLRIQSVHAEGYGSAESMERIAAAELKGTYAGMVPKNSFFFYPERAIRAAVLEAHPAVSAVSVSRTGFDSMLLKASARSSAFWWCGTPEQLSAKTGNCYETDAEGFVFEKAEEAGVEVVASSSASSMLIVYAELDSASSTASYPLRSRVLGATALTDVLRFVRAIETLGIPVASIAIRKDEAELFVAPSTRIQYVIGKEREAAKNAEAAFKGLNLLDGSIEYVDLRFDGKVYLKRTGE